LYIFVDKAIFEEFEESDKIVVVVQGGSLVPSFSLLAFDFNLLFRTI
jgi:hypothetical protein